jgi:hypothetical protein
VREKKRRKNLNRNDAEKGIKTKQERRVEAWKIFII